VESLTHPPAVAEVASKTGSVSVLKPHAAYYNFARIHKTLRITPAMAAGLSDRVWSLEEIVQMADAVLAKPAKRGPYKKK